MDKMGIKTYPQPFPSRKGSLDTATISIVHKLSRYYSLSFKERVRVRSLELLISALSINLAPPFPFPFREGVRG
jgi:hypothetical protein